MRRVIHGREGAMNDRVQFVNDPQFHCLLAHRKSAISAGDFIFVLERKHKFPGIIAFVSKDAQRDRLKVSFS